MTDFNIVIEDYTPPQYNKSTQTENFTMRNLCIICNTDMGDSNPRQLCGKTYCYNEIETPDSEIIIISSDTEDETDTKSPITTALNPIIIEDDDDDKPTESGAQSIASKIIGQYFEPRQSIARPQGIFQV